MSRRVLMVAVVLAAACGSSSSSTPPDAGAPDAATTPDAAATPDAATGLAHLNFRETRGEPIAATTVNLSERDVIAASAQGFVSVFDCVQEGGCDYEWHDTAGGSIDVHKDLVWLNTSMASPDGSKLLLMQLESLGPCGDAEIRPTVAEGTALLLDTGSGAALLSPRMRSNIWSVPAFSTTGDYVFLTDVPEGACSAESVYRGVAPPYAPLTAPDLDLIVELDAGRWLGWRGESLTLRQATGAEVDLGEDPTEIRVAAGWVHAHHGFGVLTEEIRAVAPDGVRHTATVDPEVAWRARDTWGRWSVLCAGAREGVITRQCLVVDVTGAHPQRPLDIVVSARDLTTAFVGRGQALVFVTVVDGVLRDQRLDLESGAQRTLAEGDVGLHLLGDADAVLLHRRGDGSLLLVEGEREETVAESGVTDVLTLPGPVGGGRVARQRQTAVIVSSRGGGDASLSVLDLATRRVAALTDRLYFAPHVQAPFAWDDCGQPRMTRSAGGPLEVLVQDSRWLFFVEVAPPGGSSSLWVVPIDLSQPPRRLRDGFHPAYCHAPLSSPDGSLIVVDVDGIDGTTAVTIGRP